jgi:DNA polymerase I-like protein with 3'-5' exonuclease and polymerase domains
MLFTKSLRKATKMRSFSTESVFSDNSFSNVIILMKLLFSEVEMPSILSLAKMELNGFGFCPLEAERQRKVLMAHLEELEQEAYELAGRCFSITSPDDVCKVLYRYVSICSKRSRNYSF